jgi:dGTPase
VTVKELGEVPMAGRTMALVRARHGDLPAETLVYEMTRRMISGMVEDVLAETRARIAEARLSTVEEVRAAPASLADFSEKMKASIAELRRFLFLKVYRNPDIATKMAKAQSVLRALYEHFSDNPDAMHRETGFNLAHSADPVERRRAVGDYVAGMTDMFALKTYAALFGPPAL